SRCAGRTATGGMAGKPRGMIGGASVIGNEFPTPRWAFCCETHGSPTVGFSLRGWRRSKAAVDHLAADNAEALQAVPIGLLGVVAGSGQGVCREYSMPAS